MLPITLLFSEAITIGLLNVFGIYLVAFGYRINWKGILTFIVIASIITAYLTYVFSSKLSLKIDDKIFITDRVSALLIAGLASIPVLWLLQFRFSFPMSLGLALTSGISSMFFLNLLKDIF
jgi:hypothetical protein